MNLKPSLVSALALLTPSLAQAAGFEILAPHRAVYDVKLEKAEDRSGIVAMNGRIVYEVKGNECDGLATRFRFVTNVDTGSDTYLTDQQTSTHESADGKEFSFLTKSFVNEAADQVVRGNATRDDGKLEVNLASPAKRDIALEDAIFVSSHLVSVIEKAKQGETFISHDVFDGSGSADKIVSSTSVIGKARLVDGELEGEELKLPGRLDGENAWPVTISYFDNDPDNTSESLPVYEASFLLYDNGVTRNLTMRYPDYSLKASLNNIEFFETAPCELKN